MPVIIPFSVKSHRIHDIQLDDGTTFGDLKRILSDGGYDIADADAVIKKNNRCRVIGNVDDYKLKTRDTVSFETLDISFPALEKRMRDTRVEKESDQRLAELNSNQHRCTCEQCSHHASADTGVIYKDDHVTVRHGNDGNVIIVMSNK